MRSSGAGPIRKLLLGVAVLLVCALAVGASASSAGRSRPADLVAPWIHQRGASFVDARGRVVLLRGINATADQSRDFDKVVALKANLVRIPVKWSLLEPLPPQGATHAYDQQRLDQLDAAVAFFQRQRINVLLDFHQSRWSSYFQQTSAATRPNPGDSAGIPSWLYAGGPYPPTGRGRGAAVAAFYTDPRATELFGSFVQMIVDRYRSYPNVVGYEILNEPQEGALPSNHATTQLVIDWEAKILRIIRGEDPLRTVFFMLRGGGDLGIKQANLTAFHPLQRLALDLHDYFAGNAGSGYTLDAESRSATFVRTGDVPEYTGSIANQRAYLATVLARTSGWKIPLLIGEWGARRDDPRRLVYQSQMLSLFGSLGLSWTRWNLDRSHRYGILDTTGNLTDNGLQLSRYLHSTPSTIIPTKRAASRAAPTPAVARAR